MMDQIFVEALIEDAVYGRKSVREVADQLLAEMGRGGRTLVFDENVFGVEPFLARMGYSTRLVEAGQLDSQIIPRLRAKVFITKNGRDFVHAIESAYFGLVWVTSTSPDQDLAKKINDAMMAAGFGANLTQVIKV